MRLALTTVIAFLSALWASNPAEADVRVTFVAPDHYRDFETETASMRAEMLNEFRRTLDELGARYLNPGQILKIEVLDIERAGIADTWNPTAGDLRIVGSTMPPPRFEVRYTLQQKGKIVAQARETITDINYMLDPSARLSSDPLVYEKETLRNWFRERFGEATRSR
jgi:hypothetical protein